MSKEIELSNDMLDKDSITKMVENESDEVSSTETSKNSLDEVSRIPENISGYSKLSETVMDKVSRTSEMGIVNKVSENILDEVSKTLENVLDRVDTLSKISENMPDKSSKTETLENKSGDKSNTETLENRMTEVKTGSEVIKRNVEVNERSYIEEEKGAANIDCKASIKIENELIKVENETAVAEEEKDTASMCNSDTSMKSEVESVEIENGQSTAAGEYKDAACMCNSNISMKSEVESMKIENSDSEEETINVHGGFESDSVSPKSSLESVKIENGISKDNDASEDTLSKDDSKVMKRNSESVVDVHQDEEKYEKYESESKPKKAREEKSDQSLPSHKPLTTFGSSKPAGKQSTIDKWCGLKPQAFLISSANSPDKFQAITSALFPGKSLLSSPAKSPYTTRGNSIADERARWLSMSREEKRRYYKCGDEYITLELIRKWPEHYARCHKRLQLINPSGREVREFISDRKIPVDDDINSKISLYRGSITSLEIDAVVNAANKLLLGGGGIDGAIHKAAGSALLAECRTLGGCDTGKAKTTAGYQLPAKYIIHTVGPMDGCERMLRSCYKNCFREMLKHSLRSIAFCCISTGIYGYPPSEAVHVALDEARDFLEDLKSLNKLDQLDRVIFCLFGESDVKLYESWAQIYFPINQSADTTTSASSSSASSPLSSP